MSEQLYYLLSEEPATFDKGMCMWWRPRAAGYTVFLESAGLYTGAEARKHICGVDGTYAIPQHIADGLRRTVVYVDDKKKLRDAAVSL